MRRLLSFIVVAVLAAACSKTEQEPAWSKIDLAADGRAVVRDVADCGDHWWAVGAVQTGEATRPAAWTGGPGAVWTEVRFAPAAASYYGPRQVIRSVACRHGHVAMVGAVPGGAHGNPRVSTWRLRPDGRMGENPAPFELYGGDEAIDVGPLAAGPEGFAIAGTRTTGAAIWLSPDGATYTLHESDRPGTFATGVTARSEGGWLVTGTAADQQPTAWTVDGRRWTVAPAPEPTSGPTTLKVADDSLWQAAVHR